MTANTTKTASALVSLTAEELSLLVAEQVAIALAAQKAAKAKKGGWEPTYGRTPSETRDAALQKYGDTSKAIRALKAEGYTNAAIAKYLDIRPQHVYNVLNTPLKG